MLVRTLLRVRSRNSCPPLAERNRLEQPLEARAGHQVTLAARERGVIARPLGEWDLGWSLALHRWLPLANALPVGIALAFFFGVNTSIVSATPALWP